MVPSSLQHLCDEALDAPAASRERRIEEDEPRPLFGLEDRLCLLDTRHAFRLPEPKELNLRSVSCALGGHDSRDGDVPRRLTFGAHADAYERARPEWPEEAARWLVPEGAELVVELGAGTGKLTRAVASLGVRVVAVEPDPRMLAVLRGLGLEGVEGSAEAIPFGDGVADAVVAGSSLHWFELELALPEIHRVLRPGGRFGFGWNHRDDRHPAIAGMAEAVHEAQERTRGPRWRSARLGDRAGSAAVSSRTSSGRGSSTSTSSRARLYATICCRTPASRRFPRTSGGECSRRSRRGSTRTSP